MLVPVILAVVLLGVIVLLHHFTNGASTKIVGTWGGICIFVAICYAGVGLNRIADNADDINNNDIEAVKNDIDTLQGSIDEFNATADQFHTDFDENTDGLDDGLEEIRGELNGVKCTFINSFGTPDEKLVCDALEAQQEEKKEKDNG